MCICIWSWVIIIKILIMVCALIGHPAPGMRQQLRIPLTKARVERAQGWLHVWRPNDPHCSRAADFLRALVGPKSAAGRRVLLRML